MLLMTESLRRNICRLLEKSHIPRVAVRPSQLPGAGNGVYYVNSGNPNHDDDDDDDDDDERQEVLCLYPGVYTPPLPSVLYNNPAAAGILCNQEDNNELLDTYLAKYLPPSQVDMDDNGYIMNLETVGGYIDGLALHSSNNGDSCSSSSSISRLDASPSACGHLINHYRPFHDKPNVTMISFLWKDVLQEDHFLHDYDHRRYHQLPNVMRCDGSPWYFDIISQSTVHFPDRHDDSSFRHNSTTTVLHPLLAGAAIVSVVGAGRTDDDTMYRSRRRLETDQELVLDYRLNIKKLPNWAKDWYQP
ncbi:hypothetical protein IV203_034361 [Nitzschia inconspicua]|uniref:Uncharacterized protein n=1 Tax=Nitzschia inconspicua TaxID=303405 RepID=A0A9K3M452_9STRA|nr:hypothetical protein IV203_022834 [Nitzschia inconspicua]KAG7373637.1 hypothetical protein IV203_034361 [Nitzschia inconspicua]